MLTEDDIKQLIAACLNSRDRALIALLYDSGMRVGLIIEKEQKKDICNLM